MGTDGDSREHLYQRIKRELRAEVARGEYTPGARFITQREVCERFRVSTITAVRALNELVGEGLLVRRRGKGTFVSEPLVLAPLARAAVPTTQATIACIVHGLQGPHTVKLVSGVESVCADLGYRLYLTDTAGMPDREERALRQAMETGVDGVVLYPLEGEVNADVLGDLRRRRMPLVLVDRYRNDLATDAVTADNFAVGYRLTEQLSEQGHRRIATLWSETRCSSVTDRLAGHKRALHDKGLPVQPELTMLRPYLTLPDAARHSILEGLLTADDPATVLLCANGFVLAAAANDLMTLGHDVPGTVELAGMDDAGPFDLLPLAAVSALLPSQEIGRQAMTLLAERIGSDDPYLDTRHLVLPIEIRSRDTAAGHLRAVSTT